MRRLKLAGIFLLLTVFMLAGCASFDKRAVQVLSVTVSAQDAGGHIVASLYRDGKITQEDWNKFAKYNDQFVVGHRNAVAGLAKYRLTKTPGDKSALEKLLTDVLTLSETVAKIVSELTNKKGG